MPASRFLVAPVLVGFCGTLFARLSLEAVSVKVVNPARVAAESDSVTNPIFVPFGASTSKNFLTASRKNFHWLNVCKKNKILKNTVS